MTAAPAPDWAFDGVRVWRLSHRQGTHGEAAVRALLGKTFRLPADAVPLARDARGRPQLHAPLAGHDCNWSHSGQRLLLALGEGLRLGIDVELIRPRPRVAALAERYFHPDEAAWLRAQPDDARLPAFVRLWCAKEAVLKAHGEGIAFGLEKLRFGEHDGRLRLDGCVPALGTPADWALHEWAPEPGYRAALAWRAAIIAP